MNLPARKRAMKSRQPERVLYLMHVDWGWIKQRPQFLAEELSNQGFAVEVHYVPTLRRGRLTRNKTTLSPRPLPVAPRWFHPVGQAWNRTVGKLWLTVLLALRRPSILWVTFPGFADILPRKLGHTALVYDAMDLAAGFYDAPRSVRAVVAAEQSVVRRAAAIVCSSQHIASHLAVEFEVPQERLHVVRNAYDSRQSWKRTLRPAFDGRTRLVYVGTISWWLDRQILCRLVDNGIARVTLYGPLVSGAIPPELEYGGVIPHERLSDVAVDADCFVMPFVVDDLIRGVDPVKIYEYLAMGRPVIAPRYDALTVFQPFVRLYSTDDQFVDLVRQLRGRRAPDFTSESLSAFLAENDWGARGGQLADIVRSAVARR